MSVISSFIKWAFFSKRIKRIEFFKKHPQQVQKATLLTLLTQAAKTEWGQKYNYSKIRSYEEFKTQVPVSSYEEVFPYIERMMKGEQNILWGSKINWFSKSSGTTNARSKFIPVSKESLQTANFRGGIDIYALYLENAKNSEIFLGKGLSIGGSFQESDTKGIFYGDVSAVMTQNLPFWAQYLRTPSLEVALLPNWEEKIERMAEECINQNVTSILGVPTWTIVLIQRLLESTGKKNIKEIWANLEVFFHGAVAFAPYKELFNQIAPNINYMEAYNASEGFFAMRDDLSRDDMLLMLDYGIFYEFVPMEEVESHFPNAITIENVELNKNYVLVISTNGGLWRYKIGDTVKFTSKNPYRIKISGRTKHFINAFGEELMVENADNAITAACKATNAIIAEFTACPIYMENSLEGSHQKGGHEWLIEFIQQPNDFEVFTKILDETLRKVNSDYDAKRYLNIALNPPMVRNMPQGTFHEWMKRRNKLGGQHKVPRLANTREYVDDILICNV